MNVSAQLNPLAVRLYDPSWPRTGWAMTQNGIDLASGGGADNTNRRLFERLFHAGLIDICSWAVFPDSPRPLAACFDFGRAEGMMLGLAVGDALGNTSESLNPSDRRSRCGEIRDYLPNRYADGRAIGLPSDDSQMAFWTLSRCLRTESCGQNAWPHGSARIRSSA